MYKEMNSEICMEDRLLCKALLKRVMEDSSEELDFFRGLAYIKKPSLQTFIEEQEKKQCNQKVQIFAKKQWVLEKLEGHKALKIASLLVAFLLCATLLTFLLKPAPSTAGKTELDLSKQKVENGFIEDSHVGMEEKQAIEEIIDDEKYISAMKEKCEGLLIPTYIPEGYVFEKLSVTQSDDGSWKAVFSYCHEKKKLNIIQRKFSDNNGAAFMNEVSGFEELEDGKIFYQEDKKENNNMLVMVCNDQNAVRISGNIIKGELLEIQKKLKE